MKNAILTSSLIVLGFFASNALAAEVALAYKGVVTGATGAHSTYFQAGQQINFRYVVETSAEDSNAASDAGYFPGGLRELQIVVPEAGISTSTGPGSVQTWDNSYSGKDDAAYFYSQDGVTGQLAGLPINYAEVDFRDSAPVGLPMMIDSDAIPTTHLVGNLSYAWFRTSAGWTRVDFAGEPDVAGATCGSEGYTGMKLEWCKNICEREYSGTLLAIWVRRWTDRYRTLPYCAAEPQQATSTAR